jgi:hypothetical protein
VNNIKYIFLIRDVSVSDLGAETSMSEIIQGTPQSLQANVGIVDIGYIKLG